MLYFCIEINKMRVCLICVDGGSIFVTPTRPSARELKSNVPTTPTTRPSTSSEVASPSDASYSSVSQSAASPSVSGTQTSMQTGSLFHNEETAKIQLNELLQRLGVRAPDKRTKAKPRRLYKLMHDAMDKFRNIFKQYAGGKLPDIVIPCECEQCTIIIASVKAKIHENTCKKEKYEMLTTLPRFVTVKQMVDDFHVSQYMARKASKLRSTLGPFSFPEWKTTGKSLDENVKIAVVGFYLSEDNSRIVPTLRECVYVRNEDGSRRKAEKRMMMANLKDSYQEFKNAHSGMKIGISKFAELRPKNVRWPGNKGVHYTCTCFIHGNFKFMLTGLKEASLEGIETEFENDPTSVSLLELFDDYKEFSKYMICDPPTEECYMGYCGNCPIEINWDRVMQYSADCNVTYQYWEKNEITLRVEEQSKFLENLAREFAKFLTHDFIYQQQKEYIKELKNGPLENGTSCVMTVDFGENYNFVVQDSVQSYHWNNNQCTVHPFVLYTASDVIGQPLYKTYFIISDDLCHDASAFHTFRVRVLNRMREQFPKLRHIDYVSDGASSQYKNYLNISNLLYHQDDFNLTARWIYTA